MCVLTEAPNSRRHFPLLQGATSVRVKLEIHLFPRRDEGQEFHELLVVQSSILVLLNTATHSSQGCFRIWPNVQEKKKKKQGRERVSV